MVKVGCIADDYTGATDLAGALVRAGLRVVQAFGVPDKPIVADADVIIIALKTRSASKSTAVEQSVAAVRWLREMGAERFLFKYCSTFDSTPEGNIGPVTEALIDELHCACTILCPAFPRNGRTQYMGHLFVGRLLLSDSGMRDHPLTPMKDSNLVRVLEEQATQSVGLVDLHSVLNGSEAIAAKLNELSAAHPLILTDAVATEHLALIARATGHLPLITGGSAIAEFMAERWRELQIVDATRYLPAMPSVTGPTIVLSGSCSDATQSQVANYAKDHASLQIDLLSLHDASPPAVAQVVDSVVDWVLAQVSPAPLVYTTASVSDLSRVQSRFGVQEAADLAECCLAQVAVRLAERGYRNFIVAGGETSGAIVGALGIEAIRIGPEICTGVPWVESLSGQKFALALKSGNFGGEHFFADAQAARNLDQDN